jgi:Putative polyhydroxyalkanoic acid system protein (PHA_gran_rgn)
LGSRTGKPGVYPGMMTAVEPIVVTISHRLGRDEAKRRIEGGLGAIRGELARYVRHVDYAWDGYRLDFRVSAMMQTITGRLEVYEEFVKVELALPRLLHLLARRITGRIEHRGAALLEAPKEKK